MKRFLWLTYLSCSIAALSACGGGSKKTGDGGIEGDGSAGPDGSASLDAIKKEADATKKLADDLGTQLASVKSAAAGTDKTLAGLDTRVKNLENPAAPVPLDGIALASMGILKLVEEACNYEGACCNADELTLKYGPTIQSSKDCIDTFNQLVAKGVNPNFLQTSVPVVQYVVSIAQALSSSEVKVQLNKTAITACTDWLHQRKCTTYVAPPDPLVQVTPHCTPLADVVVNPCEVAQLVSGMQGKGELCGVVYGVGGCKDGLVCRSQNSGRGICTEPLGEGGRCLNDAECGGVLFCNLAKGQCQKRGDEGADCEYLDPSFTSNMVNIALSQSTVPTLQPGLAIQCNAGLECQPSTKKCVKVCADGSLCTDPQYNSGVHCPEGLVCNVTEVPSLYSNTAPGTASYRLGICKAPGAGGDPCTLTTGVASGSECESGNCQLTSGGGYVCGDPKKKAGDACTAAGTDPTCTTGWCGTDLKCVTLCARDNLSGLYSCPTGFYCEMQQYISGTSGTEYACEPIIDSGNACGNYGTDTDCKSGFCNGNNTANNHNYGTCEDKVALNAPCPAYVSEQCQSTQWCDSAAATAYTCVDVIAPGADCSAKPQGCGVGNYCYYDSTATPMYACRVPGDASATCVGTAGSTQDCKAPLVCAADHKCHEANKYPDGVPCGSGSSPNDAQCLSGWCSGASATSVTKPFVCATPIADGGDCDTTDTYKNRCEKTAYCAHDASSSAGKCTKQHTTGQACEPRYAGTDCLNHALPTDQNICELANGVFVCNEQSLAPKTALCDGK